MVNSLFEIQGRKAIVTGGSRGLGRGMAEALLEAGCEVVIVGSSDASFSTAEEFRSRGFSCNGLKADLSSREQVSSSFEKALAVLGGDLDILITAAGIQRRHLSEDFPLGDWDQVLDVNLHAVFMQCQMAGRVMLKKNYGKIINVASMACFFGGQTIPAYAASKGGVMQLTKALSNDWVGRGVNVNAVAPGYMATEMNSALLANETRLRQISERIPAGRWGTPADMKGITLFLSSAASDYISGAIIPVDGGYLVK